MDRKRHDRSRDREDYKDKEEFQNYAQKKTLQSLQSAVEDMRESNSLIKDFFDQSQETMRRIEDAVEAQKDAVSAVFDVVNQLNSTMKCILEVEKMKIRRLELDTTTQTLEDPIQLAEEPILHSKPIETPEKGLTHGPTIPSLMKGSNPQAALKLNLAHARCYRCNKSGHHSPDCPLIDYGLWFCYFCQEVREHKGDNCPKSTKFGNKRFKPYGKPDYENHRKGNFFKQGKCPSNI